MSKLKIGDIYYVPYKGLTNADLCIILTKNGWISVKDNVHIKRDENFNPLDFYLGTKYVGNIKDILNYLVPKVLENSK